MYLIRIHTPLGIRYLAPLALMLAVVACSLAGHTTMCSEAPWRIEALCYPALDILIPVLHQPPSVQDLVYKMLAVMVDAFKAFCENVQTSHSLRFIAAANCHDRRLTVLCSTSVLLEEFVKSVLECGLQPAVVNEVC